MAEAKGCHDRSGTGLALGRAWRQAERIDIVVGGRRAPLKRVAIATRWGTASGKLKDPLLSVRDPTEPGEITPDEILHAALGVARIHATDLLFGLGYKELSAAIRMLTTAGERMTQSVVSSAKHAMEGAPVHEPSITEPLGPQDVLFGRWITRAGPLPETTLSTADQDALRRLQFRPIFVGMERQVVSALITGDVQRIRDSAPRTRTAGGAARSDGAGGWTIRVTGSKLGT